ncbi:hypothetical protein CH330_05365 [candidate division WOR-3 bacterium JGI_Cruoil_03_51_56]|uniref:Uncharacterized protein n=1 Tax=candidate division WOR-3 bacterium JGI_Cruoil_03_51_56 TaxID=1973747 RepID=A0A235BTL9_UNCW3|nr:MAG: hypothetical protein CH330_05365 [candidate division WOR-3 bacterium JGI_Cruoil_03_51_56]
MGGGVPGRAPHRIPHKTKDRGGGHQVEETAAEKAKYRPGERTCNDTKYLDDISQYWSQARDLKLPWYQYSHRDVRTGMMFLGFVDELSLSHSTAFAEIFDVTYNAEMVLWPGRLLPKGERVSVVVQL